MAEIRNGWGRLVAGCFAVSVECVKQAAGYWENLGVNKATYFTLNITHTGVARERQRERERERERAKERAKERARVRDLSVVILCVISISLENGSTSF